MTSHVNNNKRSFEIDLQKTTKPNKRLKKEAQIAWRAKVSRLIQAHPIPKRNFTVQKKSVRFTSLPQEILEHVFEFLRPCDIVNFEGVCKTHTQLTGDSVWKKLREKNYLNFEFAMCAGMSERDRFFFADAVFRYLLEPSKNPLYAHEKIYPKYDFLMARFPNLKQLILEDLNDYYIANRKFRQRIVDNSRGWAGENLILGMFAKKSKNRSYAKEYFEIALKKNATCAAILSTRVCSYKKAQLLVCQAADLGDYRAMECYLELEDRQFLSSLYDQNRLYPPVLWEHGIFLKKEKKYNEAGASFKEAIAGYLKQGKPVPPTLLYDAAANEQNKQEAENLFDWALNLVTKPWFSLLLGAGIAKCNLSNWKEAALLFKEALKFPETEQIEQREHLFYMAGIAQLRLGKFTEAKELLNKEKSTDNQYIDKIDLMAKLAEAHIGLKEFDEAKECLNQALKLYDSARPEFLSEIAYCYLLLKDWPEAERRYDQSIKDFGLQNKPLEMKILANFSSVKNKQNKWEESLEPLMQIVNIWQDETPADIHETIAKRYLKLNRKPDAEIHFDKALNIREEEGISVPNPIFDKTYQLKKELRSQEESFDYLKRVIAINEERSSYILGEFIQVNWKINQWDELAKYYPEYITALQSEGKEVTPFLADYAFVLETIGELEDSIDLLKRVEAELNDKMRVEIRERMAFIYFQLKDFEKSDEAYEKAFEKRGSEKTELNSNVVCHAIRIKDFLGKKEEAAYYLTRTIAHYESIGRPIDSHFLINLGEQYAALSLWPSAEEAYEKALANFHLNGLEEPIEILRHLVIIKKNLKKYKEVTKLFKKILLKEKKFGDHVDMAQFYLKLNRFDKAETLFEKALEIKILERSSLPMEIVQTIVRIKFRLKKQDIEVYLRKVMTYQENLGDLSFKDLCYFARVTIDQQFWELAEDCCKKALENKEFKNSLDFLYILGFLAIVKKHQGLEVETVSLLQQLIELPNNQEKIDLLYEISNIFEKLGNFREVEMCLEEVIKIAPLEWQPLVQAFNKLSHAKSKLGKLNEALELNKQIIARSNHYQLFLNASHLSHQLGLSLDAENYLKQAEKIIESMKPSRQAVAYRELAICKKFIRQ